MVAADVDAVIPWPEARDRFVRCDRYWWATTGADGQPHVRPVLALFVEGVLYSSSNPSARKARNLVANPRVAVAIGDILSYHRR